MPRPPLQFPGRAAGRSAIVVGGYQMLATAIALFFGGIAGAITGWLCRFSFSDPLVRERRRSSSGGLGHFQAI